MIVEARACLNEGPAAESDETCVAEHGRAREAGTTIPSQTNTNRSAQDATAFGIVERTLDTRTSLISVEGELDLFTAPSLKRALVNALQAGGCRLVVDMSEVTFIDSTTLGVLVGVTKRLEGDDARMAIVCARPNVRKIFEFSGLDSALSIFATLDEALAYARGNEAWAS